MSSALPPPSAARWAAGGPPWSATAWRNTTYLVAGMPVQVAGLVAILSPLLLGLTIEPLSVSLTVMLLLTLLFAAGCLALTLLLVPVLTRLQQSRLSALLGVDIQRIPTGPSGWRSRRGMAERLGSETLWRQLAYHVLAGPLAGLGALAVLGAWTVGLVFASLPLYAWALPAASPMNFAARPSSVAIGCALGLALLVAAPQLAAVAARLDVTAARALLGPNRARELQLRVDRLAVSRAALLEAADLERRRIERDLHDGVQQRLVALAMKLGIARATYPGLTPEVRQLLTEVHGEAKETLTELRDLVRGLHPAVLDEQGLDAALSGIAARAPFPVKLHVSADGRAAPAIEAVAYFVVSEALANIAKHAQATRADIHLERAADILRVTVTDDGIGGADPAGGTGLVGLTQRVSSVDGTFSISSPVGGPTRITVELPCEL